MALSETPALHLLGLQGPHDLLHLDTISLVAEGKGRQDGLHSLRHAETFEPKDLCLNKRHGHPNVSTDCATAQKSLKQALRNAERTIGALQDGVGADDAEVLSLSVSSDDGSEQGGRLERHQLWRAALAFAVIAVIHGAGELRRTRRRWS